MSGTSQFAVAMASTGNHQIKAKKTIMVMKRGKTRKKTRRISTSTSS
jgi:hypothetical protein